MTSALVCLALGAGAAIVGLVPRWRSQWGWGRGGSAGPISPVGWVRLVTSFWVMAASLTAGAQGWFDDPFYALVGVLLGFSTFIAAGLFDAHRRR